jgi:glucose/arabinose dehydrogenase
MRRTRMALLATASGLLLSACGAAGGSDAPTWEPSPALGGNGNGPGAQASPIVPVPSLPKSQPPTKSSGRPRNQPSPSVTGKGDPNVVATHLHAPVGLTMLPDGTALVGERTTGRIVRVQPLAGRPVPTVRQLSGLDTSGDGGLLDLALSPTYSEDGLIYAYVTTATDNRVVDFTLKGPVTPVLVGIPKGSAGNTGRIAFGGDGDLYVGTGDAGRAADAANPRKLAGKVLRIDDIGDPAGGNPSPSSPVWTSGHYRVNGLCPVPQATAVLEVEAGPAGRPDDVNDLVADSYYGWPAANSSARPALGELPDPYRSPGGCAVLDNHLWVTSLDGRALLSAPLKGIRTTPAIGKFSAVLTNKYGRLKTVVAADDGALWLTTSNRDGSGSPVSADERVIRYLPTGGGGGAPV